MTVFPRATLGFAAGALLVFCGAGAALAESVITVSLWDRGAGSVMMDGQHMFMMNRGFAMNRMPMAMMGIDLSETTVPAGMVTFNVTNASRGIIHEMVVSPITSTDEVMPYIVAENKIDEDAAGDLGEIELDPGRSGTLGIDMKPGQYLLYCNISGHYVSGMWAVLTVTE